MNRTRGFVNLNRFKSGRAAKRLSRITDEHETRPKLKNRKDRK